MVSMLAGIGRLGVQAVHRQYRGEAGRAARRLAAAEVRSSAAGVRAAADRWWPALTGRERRAVLAYKWLGSFGTNEALRKASERSQSLVRRRRRRVRLLDSAPLSVPPLNAPVIVYRGQPWHSRISVNGNGDAVPGPHRPSGITRKLPQPAQGVGPSAPPRDLLAGPERGHRCSG